VVQVVYAGDTIGTHAVHCGTPVQEWLGVAPNGKSIEVHEITTYKVENGKFVQMSNVWDLETLKRQLAS
jgi:predicted ester cyclase